ncbi:MAG: hypothetical protein HOG05_04370 [Bacteroidetes bacterium]|jgi:hypothetical protein|nr:hypothetical protein [Bacteroidota bacterium]MBT5530809.1 hypothetical protein [Cytophagia bacterium]MBT3934007.1 hypothetical protein [Bacteroidota bacterium]MBT4729476.1 hypothetical protein [Bacteroidota bacterium]MBT4969802.1 hypothetical protein [Bacteroidota bacterium]
MKRRKLKKLKPHEKHALTQCVLALIWIGFNLDTLYLYKVKGGLFLIQKQDWHIYFDIACSLIVIILSIFVFKKKLKVWVAYTTLVLCYVSSFFIGFFS